MSTETSPSPTGRTAPATAADFALDGARYEAIRSRDPRAEGHFFYAVLTTGVYCRPTCAARLALRENVRFHSSPEAAEQAGFRPCKRCQPRELPRSTREEQLVARLRLQLAAAEAPSLAALAKEIGLGEPQLQRVFKKHVGMTPRAYAAAHRLQRMSNGLREGAPVTEALYEAGYSSSSRFYATESGALGMHASELRRGAEGVQMQAFIRACSLGQVLIAATSRGVCAIQLGSEPDALHQQLRERFPLAEIEASDRDHEALAERIVAMIDGSEVASDLPLDLIGTAFQRRVWRTLRDIPRGATASYAEIARQVGTPQAVRAVGTACGQNPVAVAVPCHRVVRQDGSLGGYRWGLERKRALLAREQATDAR